MSKRTFELLKNIKIVCFIPPTYINRFTKFLENNLIDNNENIFMKYLKKTRITKNYRIYNYFELLDKDILIDGLKHFYITNNIAKSLHSKLKVYLPTKKCSNINFLIAIRNIIKNSELKKSDIIRKDYVTRTLFE